MIQKALITVMQRNMHSQKILQSKKDCSSFKLTNRFQSLAIESQSPTSKSSLYEEGIRKLSIQAEAPIKRMDLDWRVQKSTKLGRQSTVSRPAPKSATIASQNRDNGGQSKYLRSFKNKNMNIKKLFGKDFFQPGLIIRADLHEEDFKTARLTITPAKTNNAPSGAVEGSANRYERNVHTKERKMIVLACYERHYICIPLYSHEGQGLKNKNVSTLSPFHPIFVPPLHASVKKNLEQRKLTSIPFDRKPSISLYVTTACRCRNSNRSRHTALSPLSTYM